jgi:hypothetical protein
MLATELMPYLGISLLPRDERTQRAPKEGPI